MQSRMTWKMVLALLIGAPIVNIIADEMGKIAAEAVNKSQEAVNRKASPAPEIRVLVFSQDPDGVSPEQFDLDFLKKLEVYMVERSTIKAKEYLTSQGYPDANVKYASEATYVESGSMKLAVIRMSAPGLRQVVVAGIVGSEFKRVSCLRASEEAIPITRGVCADKVKEAFGVSLGG